ncbi:Translation machinery-associated protein 22 [Saitozyma podzolica]|uniref:Translation machinery-associated protein 22 n=1 Tax=Saitozyma podzolica TaxID=1890683 RepID=A0A427YGZ1_9TREE|nr:Translation machinery-associated protein 22 [Saitozyma podzolica]
MSVAGPSTKPVTPHYCGVCSLPTEYCEFGPSFSKCKTWLEGKDREEYERLWGADSLTARIGTLSVEKQEKLEADAAKAEKKAEKKAEQEAKKKEASEATKVDTAAPLLLCLFLPLNCDRVHRFTQLNFAFDMPPIIIKRSERTRRKHATHIHGLDAFGLDLKKVAKFFAGKFATGSSVSKNPQGEDEIVVQGDVGDEIVEMLRQQVSVLKGAPADQVVRVEDKKKKAAEEA